MRKISTFFLILIFILSPLYGREEVIFEKAYGGPKSEKGYGIVKAVNGYILVGETTSYGSGGKDVYVVKIDRKGNPIWEKSFGGPKDDFSYSVIKANIGYLIVGGTKSFGKGNTDLYLLKIDEEGNLIWQKTYGGKGVDEGWRISKTSDGNYVIVGRTTSFGKGNYDFYILKVDDDGEIIWEKAFGREGSDYGYDIVEAPDGSILAVGTSNSFSEDQDVYIVKIDKEGNPLWEKIFGCKNFDFAYSVIFTGDGYLVVGNSNSFSETPDLYLLKINTKGDKIWEKVYGGNGYDTAFYVTYIGKGESLVVGATNSKGAGNSDAYVVKIDKNGNLLWEGTFGGADLDEGWYAVKDLSNFVIIGRTESFGTANSEMYVIKFKL
ncbi:MAG TPA: hypothetical protein PKW23_07370 [Dictyoglomaceae bacterium]|nr:hypothetical protein [Dictyoglomaceae bacterium]HPP16462.1 hypothetical protein [Dictyoglomaceae bacterium]